MLYGTAYKNCFYMLKFIYGTMSSGKSLHLLATAYSFQEHKIPFLTLKSKIDDRDGENVVYSRALGKRECVMISVDDNIFYLISKYLQISNSKLKYILVDEAQFLTEKQVDELAAISDILKINIICYGLKTDFKTKLFPGSKRLIEISDEIQELPSICYCGNNTMFNARINANKEIVTDGNQIEVGGDDRYVALCRKCYFEKTGNKFYVKNNEDE